MEKLGKILSAPGYTGSKTIDALVVMMSALFFSGVLGGSHVTDRQAAPVLRAAVAVVPVAAPLTPPLP